MKDNFEVAELPSAVGSKALAGFTSDRDAFVVARMKTAGAIVLAAANMAELGFSPYETISSLHGQTRNPYALDPVPAGSSVGDLTSPHGDNSWIFAPSSRFPAINVPMGYTRNDRLPAGLTLLGRAWDEATLIRLASCYELATKHRRLPPSTPPLD